MKDLRELFSDASAKILFTAIVTAALVLFNVPKEKQEAANALAMGIFGLAALYVGGKSYEKGKLNEGTVPDGRTPTGGGVTVNLPQMDLGVPLNDERPSQESGSGSGAVTGLLLAMLFVGLSGCSTIQQAISGASFKAGAKETVSFIADETRGYITDDDALNDLARAEAISKVDRLTESVANDDSISVTSLKAAWSEVRPIYLQYIDADKALDVEEKQIFVGNATKFDTLIEEEIKRRNALLRR